MATDLPIPKHAYSVPEVAKATDTSTSYLYLEMARGELQSCLAGDRRLITPAQVEAWLARKAEAARAQQEAKRQKAAKPRRRAP